MSSPYLTTYAASYGDPWKTTATHSNSIASTSVAADSSHSVNPDERNHLTDEDFAWQLQEEEVNAFCHEEHGAWVDWFMQDLWAGVADFTATLQNVRQRARRKIWHAMLSWSRPCQV
jgi:hypothetical protein